MHVRAPSSVAKRKPCFLQEGGTSRMSDSGKPHLESICGGDGETERMVRHPCRIGENRYSEEAVAVCRFISGISGYFVS